MGTLFLVAILIVLVVRWFVVSGQIEELQRRLDIAEDASDPREVDRLKQRVSALEAVILQLRSQPAPAPVSAPIVAEASEAPPEPIAPRAVPDPGSAVEPPPPDVVIPGFVELSPEFSPALAKRVRDKMSGQEWEAIVGGSWLNKLGVFVLVIGVALFLGYSFTQMGPAGRSLISLAVSAALLAAGVLVERRARYQIFARGLLGGGWAALYFTVYAMHAVEASKVIQSPIVGTLLLFAVACGMIVHSLWYRSQAVTGLAYFVAFATLAITPVTALSVVALIPLAASLLYIASRFEWPEMAVCGLIATYGTCLLRGHSDAPLWSSQAILATYWVLFESFDLLRSWRHSNRTVERALLPLNALAFVSLSYAKWSSSAPHQVYALAAGTAAAYLLSTVLRARLRPPSGFPPEAGVLDRIFAGGYEGPITLTAILSAFAVLLKLHGSLANLGLLAEAELLFLAGLYFGQEYPRRLAIALFTTFLGKLLLLDIGNSGRINFSSWTIRNLTPTAVLAGVLFYVNRALHPRSKIYGYAATGVFAVIIGFEAPGRFRATAWFLLAAAVFVFGWLRRLLDFRVQGYIVAVLALLGVGVHEMAVAAGQATAARYPWMVFLLAVVLLYGAVLCALRAGAGRLDEHERIVLRSASSWATTITLLGLAWRILPAGYVGLGWMALALPVLELGLRGLPTEFRAQSYLIAALGAGEMLFFNVLFVHPNSPLPERLAIAGAALIAYSLATRVFLTRRKEDRSVVAISSAVGTVFLSVALWALLPASVVAPAWAVAALLLMEVGLLSDMPGIRWQSYALAALTFCRSWTAGLSSVFVIAAFFIAQFLLPRPQKDAKGIERHARLYYSLLATVLLTVLLFHQVSGRLLTMAWGVEGLALLTAGFPLRDRILRLSGLMLFVICVLKLFLYDLRQLETFYRILSFIVLGLILVTVSWAYTRFRDRIQRYL